LDSGVEGEIWSDGGKDIVTLDDGGGQTWFNEEVTRNMRNGSNTSFWNTKWRGDMMFREKYPRLFAISNQKELKVAEMWLVRDSSANWNFKWRRRLFVWEEELLNNLLNDLQGFEWSQDEDEWK